MGDAAHSLGASYNGENIGAVADFTVFSFHAVKNVTTAEGGAVTFKKLPLKAEEIYRRLKTLSLHGQSKDALSKTEIGSWEYDILFPGYKCNMTDISAALGLVQLKRYKNKLKKRRREIFDLYTNKLSSNKNLILPEYTGKVFESSCHLFLLRIRDFSVKERDQLIKDLGKKGIPVNVHYKPLPLLKCYRELGYKMEEYPNAYNQFENEVTLPLHTLLTDMDIKLITDSLLNI